jgi:heat shock protein 1/8
LDSNPDSDISEYERQQKSLEDLFNPIMAKVYQAAGGQPGGFPEQGQSEESSGKTTGPKVD